MSITCNEEETLFQLQINVKNDNGYIIMNWKIEDQYGDILHQSGNSNQLFHAYTETTNEEFCLDRSTCYKFSISSNTFRNAGYSLYQDRSLVMSNPGTGGSFSSDDYRIDDKYLSCVTSSPSISPTALEESSDVYISMIVGLMFLCAFVAGLIHSWDRCRTNDQRERRQRQQQRTTAAEEEETRKQNRRFKILTGIIHKVSPLKDIAFFRCGSKEHMTQSLACCYDSLYFLFISCRKSYQSRRRKNLPQTYQSPILKLSFLMRLTFRTVTCRRCLIHHHQEILLVIIQKQQIPLRLLCKKTYTKETVVV